MSAQNLDSASVLEHEYPEAVNRDTGVRIGMANPRTERFYRRQEKRRDAEQAMDRALRAMEEARSQRAAAAQALAADSGDDSDPVGSGDEQQASDDDNNQAITAGQAPRETRVDRQRGPTTTPTRRAGSRDRSTPGHRGVRAWGTDRGLDVPRAVVPGLPPAHDPRLRLPKYSGQYDLQTFLIQLETAAEFEGWSDRATTAQLIMALEGEALSAIDGLPDRRDGEAIINALKDRFRETDVAERSVALLQDRVRKAGEPLAVFAADLRRLVRRGYPISPREEQDRTLRRAFLRGLTPVWLRRAVNSLPTSDFSTTLQEAGRLETNLAPLEEPQPLPSAPRTDVGSLYEEEEEVARRANMPVAPDRYAGRGELCYHCQGTGHVAAYSSFTPPLQVGRLERARGLYLPSESDGPRCRALVDTGSTISLASSGEQSQARRTTRRPRREAHSRQGGAIRPPQPIRPPAGQTRRRRQRRRSHTAAISQTKEAIRLPIARRTQASSGGQPNPSHPPAWPTPVAPHLSPRMTGERHVQHGVVIQHRYYRHPPPADAAPATRGGWSGARRRRRQRPAGERVAAAELPRHRRGEPWYSIGEPARFQSASETSSTSDETDQDETASTDGEPLRVQSASEASSTSDETDQGETAPTDGEARESTDGEPSRVQSTAETSSTPDMTGQNETAHTDSRPGEDLSAPARRKRPTKKERRRRAKAAAAARQALGGGREEDGLASGEATGGVENEASTVPPPATPTSAYAFAVAEEEASSVTLESDDSGGDPTDIGAWWLNTGTERYDW